MPRRPTISPSSRKLAPKAPTRGPSWSTTSAPSSSLRRIAGSWQPADEVVAGPRLQPVGLQLRLGDAQVHGAADPLDDREGDASRAAVVALAQAVGDRLQPGAEATTDALAERARPGQDRGHQRRAAAVGDLQLEIVDLAGEPTVLVDQLPVEQVQPG